MAANVAMNAQRTHVPAGRSIERQYLPPVRRPVLPLILSVAARPPTTPGKRWEDKPGDPATKPRTLQQYDDKLKAKLCRIVLVEGPIQADTPLMYWLMGDFGEENRCPGAGRNIVDEVFKLAD